MRPARLWKAAARSAAVDTGKAGCEAVLLLLVLVLVVLLGLGLLLLRATAGLAAEGLTPPTKQLGDKLLANAKSASIKLCFAILVLLQSCH